MTPLTLYVHDAGTEAVAAATRDELTARHGFVDVETVGPLVIWPSTESGADFSALVVASVARVFRLITKPVPPTTGDQT